MRHVAFGSRSNRMIPAFVVRRIGEFGELFPAVDTTFLVRAFFEPPYVEPRAQDQGFACCSRLDEMVA